MDNFVLIAVIISVLWIAAIAFYLYTVRQQGEMVESIDELREKLDEVEDEGV
jgi:hypothetical protein